MGALTHPTYRQFRRTFELTHAVLFTGSTRVGRIVATAAAKTLTPTTLEVGHAAGCTPEPYLPVEQSITHTAQLGGKSPVIVSSCANVKIAAIRMLSMKSPCSGQTCGGFLMSIRVNPGSTLMRTVAPDYILCARDRVDDLIREFRSA